MTLLFEAIRGIFFCATMLIIMLLIAGPDRLSPYQMQTAEQVLMPAYLMIVGIVLGYILDLIGRKPGEAKETRYHNSNIAFIQGILIGIFLTLSYIFTM